MADDVTSGESSLDQLSYGLTWDDIGELARWIAGEIARDGCPDSVVGVGRGGWVPAVLISHLLGVRDLRAVEVTHTLEDSVLAAKSPRPRVVNSASLGDLRGRDVVVVDDVVGSGMTVVTAHGLVMAAGARRVRTAVCVVNEANWLTSDRGIEVTYVGSCRRGWVVFPWELS